MKEIGRIQPCLEPDQAGVMGAEGCAHTGFALVSQIVEIHLACSVRLQGMIEPPDPGNSPFRWPFTRLKGGRTETKAALSQIKGGFMFRDVQNLAMHIVVQGNRPGRKGGILAMAHDSFNHSVIELSQKS